MINLRNCYYFLDDLKLFSITFFRKLYIINYYKFIHGSNIFIKYLTTVGIKMKFYGKQTILLAILILLSFSLLSQIAFAESNDTLAIAESDGDMAEMQIDDSGVSNKISIENSHEDLSNSQNATLFIISDNPGTNILDKASLELEGENKLDNVNLVIRNGNQIKTKSIQC